jgi:hypothetical protein
VNSEKPDPLVSARTGWHWRSSHSTVEQSDRLQMVLGAMDTFPSRYGVAIRRQTKGTFLHRWLCRSKAMQWLRDHQATGSFINAGDWKGARQAMSGCIATRRGQTKRLASCGFPSSNPMYAIGNIAAGEFLRQQLLKLVTVSCLVDRKENKCRLPGGRERPGGGRGPGES